MQTIGKKTLFALAGGTVLTLAVAVAGGAVAAGGGFGGKGGPGMGDMGPFGGRGEMMDFATLDADGSGSITVDDVAALAQAKFAESDTSGDGLLDKAEVVARITARIEEGGLQPRNRGGVEWTPTLDDRRIAWMADGFIIRMDKDGDGTVSLEEATPDTSRLERLIARFDTDGDDAVSEAEFTAAKLAMHERGRQGGGHGGGHGGRGN